MDGLEKLLTSELGVFVVCLILIIREFRTAFSEYLKSKRTAEMKRETDIHIKQTNEKLTAIKKDLQTILARWS